MYTLYLSSQGKTQKEIQLKSGDIVTIGRKEDNKLVIPAPMVSGYHARIELKGDIAYLTDLGSTNGTFVNGRRLEKDAPHALKETDKVVFAADNNFGLHIGLPTSMIGGFQSGPESGESDAGGEGLRTQVMRKKTITIGRAEDCDIVLDSLRISRKHAKLEQTPNGVMVTDLGSKNGTFINGKRIETPTLLQPKDRLEIGPYKLSLDKDMREDMRTTGHAIVAEGIQKVYGKTKSGEDIVGLQTMSMKIPAKEFVALMGPSGCGKSTLMKCLNGDNPATHGKVAIHGYELEKNFQYLKRYIGYVPQDDIVHRELSVDKTLYYAAKLRLEADVNDLEIWRKIEEVLSKLNINDPKIRGNKVKELSGGQRKRVSIAVELLSEPSILFLDEPTSPLDPETIEEFLNSIRKLVNDGMTVVMVTHKPEDLNYVDKVIFLSAKGYLTYYGEKGDFLKYFDKKSIIEVYSLLSSKENGMKWNQIWNAKNAESTGTYSPEQLPGRKTGSLMRQYWWLCRRYFNIKINDKGNMFLLLAQPFIIAGLIGFIFEKLQLGVLFMMAISAVWFGVSNAAKEIVEEQAIYKRERMFNMSIFTYLFSKVTVLAIIAMVQTLIFTTIVYFCYQGREYNIDGTKYLIELHNYPMVTGFMFYLSLSATLIGLLLSAVFDNTEKVMTVVPIALIPQIMLAGVVANIDNSVKEGLSYLTLGRWGTEGFSRIQDENTTLMRRDTTYKFGSTDIEDTSSVKASVMLPAVVLHDTSFVKEISMRPKVSTPLGTQEIKIDTSFQMDFKNLPTDSVTDKPTAALPLLKFYGEDCPDCRLQWFNSFQKNLLVITILNLIIFAGIFVSLKRKDSI